MSYEFDFGAVLAYRAELLRGLGLTIGLTVTTLSGGLAVGIAAAAARMSRRRILRIISTGYVEMIRNTPMLVQLFFVFFGLPSLGIHLSPIVGAMIAITINVGAYSTEIVRAGLEATPKGQVEAGLALALTRFQIFRYVMLVPALQRVYPALASQFIIVMLGTSVASQISVDELTSTANLIQSRTFRSFEVYAVVGVIYLSLAIGFRHLFDLIAHRTLYRW
jgi:polar amino acid transport system permease protein